MPKLKMKDGVPHEFDFTGTPEPTGDLRKVQLIKGAGPRVKKGQTIAVRYLGRQKSNNGRSYHAYTVTSDQDRPQFQWGKGHQRDTADPPEADGDGYRFDDGEPLPPEPADEPPY